MGNGGNPILKHADYLKKPRFAVRPKRPRGWVTATSLVEVLKRGTPFEGLASYRRLRKLTTLPVSCSWVCYMNMATEYGAITPGRQNIIPRRPRRAMRLLMRDLVTYICADWASRRTFRRRLSCSIKGRRWAIPCLNCAL